MRLVRYSVAISLDGFIADSDGGYDWIIMDPEIDFGEMSSRFDTLVMGRKTFELTQTHPEPTFPEMKHFVISKTLEQTTDNTVVSEDCEAIIRNLKSEAGKDIWLFGGGQLFGSMLEKKLVDRIEVAIIPVLVGEGIPFKPPHPELHPLTLIEHRVFSKTGTVLLEYSVD